MWREQIDTENLKNRYRVREFDDMTKKDRNGAHEEKEEGKGDRNREEKESRSSRRTSRFERRKIARILSILVLT